MVGDQSSDEVAKPVSGTAEPHGVSPIFEDPARDYLSELFENIMAMLTYANGNGVALPDDLCAKLDKLLNSPEIRGVAQHNPARIRHIVHRSS